MRPLPLGLILERGPTQRLGALREALGKLAERQTKRAGQREEILTGQPIILAVELQRHPIATKARKTRVAGHLDHRS